MVIVMETRDDIGRLHEQQGKDHVDKAIESNGDGLPKFEI